MQAGADSGTVVYLYNDFRLEGLEGLRFCVVKNGVADPPDAVAHCPDTLYSDSAQLLLGSFRALLYEGLYKRYTQQFHAEEFPADAMYHGKLAPADPTTDKGARMYRTRISQGAANMGVNFGGHYTIVEIGCGHVCMMMALVDRIDGRVYFSDIPFDTLDGHHGLSFNQMSYLLEVNTAATNRIDGYSLVYWRKPATYLWNEKKKRFELLQTADWTPPFL